MQHIGDSITNSSSSITSYLSDKEVISGQYYRAPSANLCGRKCKRHL